MKGFVPTPNNVVDLMVEKLFLQSSPLRDNVILDPGCGTGALIEGIIRWCSKNKIPVPNIVGIESDPRHIPEAINKFKAFPSIKIKKQDFLLSKQDSYDFIIGNPPYVPITKLSEDEKSAYRKIFKTAHGRFDLYILFYEQAMKSLKPGGRLVFITPEKYIYVASASHLRELLGKKQIEEILMINEETFGNLTTYPTITTIINRYKKGNTKVGFRDGKKVCVKLTSDGTSWLPNINGIKKTSRSAVLGDITIRISCGVATGADSVFIKETNDVTPELYKFAYPTVSDRELVSNDFPPLKYSMLIPYNKNGDLISEKYLRGLNTYLKDPKRLKILNNRTCVARKPWYAFHENPPLKDILKPKILCKDITAKPHFWIDLEGKIVPRHSVYYIVLKNPNNIEEICSYLNSKNANIWIEAHCQKAANGYIRLQSNILKNIPIPEKFVN